MERFQLSLAGIPFEAVCRFPSTRSFCRDYLSDAPPLFSIEITSEDIRFEAERSEEEYRGGNKPPQSFSDAYLETLALYRKIAAALIDYDTLLFHGSAIAVDGKAYLFSARSGVGKSTHARLWRELLGEKAVMINDDKPLLRFTQEEILVYGTPWNGKHRLGQNCCYPLHALCILNRSEENKICPVSPRNAFPLLLQQSFRPEDPVKMGAVLQLLERLSHSVSLFQLSCNMKPEAAEISYSAMKG